MKIFILLFGMIPAVVMYLFGHMGDPGYVLGIVPVFYLLIAIPISKFSRKWCGIVLISLLALIQISTFFIPIKEFSHKKTNQIQFNHIREHDKRIGYYLNELNKFDPDQTLLIVLRGQHLTAEKEVKFYKYDDIKVLASYLPEYTIYDLMGVRNMFFVHFDYLNWQGEGSEIAIESNKKTLVILADYLHPEARPTNIKLNPKEEISSTKNYYTSDISQADTFNFYGFTFTRK